MQKKEIQLKKIEVVTDIICDSCGESIKREDFYMDNASRVDNGEMYYSFNSHMTLKAHWGYFSGKDMQVWTAEICEKCVDEKLSFIKFNKTETKFKTTIG